MEIFEHKAEKMAKNSLKTPRELWKKAPSYGII